MDADIRTNLESQDLDTLCVNTIRNHYTYAIVSDGDLMEGVASEAVALAGYLKLSKLIYLYDNNHVSLSVSTNLSFSEDRAKRFEAYGWGVQIVGDGNDLAAIERAIQAARQQTECPTLILVTTHLGYGSPHKQDTFEAHGSPLGEEEVRLTKQNLHFGVREHGMGSILNGIAAHGGLVPFGATFLIFSDYMRPPIRLAALMGLHVIYEAGAAQGWREYVSDQGKIISLDHFGASAPGEVLLREFGFTVENVVSKALSLIMKTKSGR